MDRHTRQIRLAGVGVEGQARIARAVVDVPGRGLAADVAARYLAGAGVGGLRVHDETVAMAARAVDASVRVEVVPENEQGDGEAGRIWGFEHTILPASPPPCFSQDELSDLTARELASGALLALAALRAALGECRTEPR